MLKRLCKAENWVSSANSEYLSQPVAGRLSLCVCCQSDHAAQFLDRAEAETVHLQLSVRALQMKADVAGGVFQPKPRRFNTRGSYQSHISNSSHSSYSSHSSHGSHSSQSSHSNPSIHSSCTSHSGHRRHSSPSSHSSHRSISGKHHCCFP